MGESRLTSPCDALGAGRPEKAASGSRLAKGRRVSRLRRHTGVLHAQAASEMVSGNDGIESQRRFAPQITQQIGRNAMQSHHGLDGLPFRFKPIQCHSFTDVFAHVVKFQQLHLIPFNCLIDILNSFVA